MIDVVIDGKPEKVLIKDVQYDYLQKEIEHIDLMRIDENQRVKVKVPLDFRGTPKGTKEGGILEKQMAELELEVLAMAIPDGIRVNVEDLELNGIIHAREVPLPPVKLMHHPDQIVCQVRTVKEEVAVVEAVATSTEPEVIGKKKEDEAAAEGEGGKAGAAKPASGAAKPAAGAAKK